MANGIYLVESAKDATDFVADGLRANGYYASVVRVSPLEAPSEAALSKAKVRAPHWRASCALVVKVTASDGDAWAEAATAVSERSGCRVVHIKLTELCSEDR